MADGCNLNTSSNMKKYLYLLLFALTATSCTEIINNAGGGNESAEICIIADAQKCNDSRVAIDGNITRWEVGDRITVALNGVGIQYTEFAIKDTSDISEDGKRAKFRGVVPTGDYYGITAIYPAVEETNNTVLLNRNAADNIFMMANIYDENTPVISVKNGKNSDLPITFEHLMHKMDINISFVEEVSYNNIAVEISATSCGKTVDFTQSQRYDFINEDTTIVETAPSIEADSNNTTLTTMLFPVEEMEDMVFNFAVYVDGAKQYDVRKPESGSYDKLAMHAGMTTSVNLELGNNVTCSVAMECEVEAKGLYATANLSDIAYLANGEEQDIHILKLEYARKNSEEWVGHEFASNAIKNGTLSQRIPLSDDDYLAENSDYKLRVTLYPTNSDFEPITSEEFEFKTISAEVTADITTPNVNISVDKLNITISNTTVYYDGLNIPDYGEVAYEFTYRKSGSNLWESLSPVELSGNGYSGAYDVTLFEEGATYEIIGRVIVNSTWVFESEAVSIAIPKSNTPTPPITGDANTTELAGQWHLTSWRGAEPAFDVYLSITEDGVVSLFQRIDSRLWETFYSTVGYDGGVITGVYTDGVAWGTSYYVTIDGDTMTWVDVTDSSDISIYTRCTLPDFTNPDIRVTSSTIERFL